LVPSQRPVHHLTWLHRAPTGAAPGALLQEMAKTLPLTHHAQWFVACEATAMRAIKSTLLNDRGLNREQLISRGYWKLGATDHPDQDTGD
jgi:NADPH-dependent ferric siderophore reductase